MSKKKKNVLTVIAISTLLLSIGTYLSFKEDKDEPKIPIVNNKDRFNIMEDLSYFYIDTFLVEKGYSTCILSFKVNRTEIVDFDYNITDIYLLDIDNNLVYSLDGKTIGQGGFEDPSMTSFQYNHETEYDISSAVRAVLSSDKDPYKYNKDLRKDIKKVREDN